MSGILFTFFLAQAHLTNRCTCLLYCLTLEGSREDTTLLLSSWSLFFLQPCSCLLSSKGKSTSALHYTHAYLRAILLSTLFPIVLCIITSCAIPILSLTLELKTVALVCSDFPCLTRRLTTQTWSMYA